MRVQSPLKQEKNICLNLYFHLFALVSRQSHAVEFCYNTQCLQNSAESGKWSVVTQNSLCLPCYVWGIQREAIIFLFKCIGSKFCCLITQRGGGLRARCGRGELGRRAARRHHSPRQGEDVVGVRAGRGGARLRRAVAPHHGPGPARPQALPRGGGARRQRPLRPRHQRRPAHTSPAQTLAQASSLEPIHHGREISGEVFPLF